jgi:hypothetical protein
MTHILHRQLRGTLPLAVSGRGIRIIDDTGKEYLDASGGAAVSCLGHGHPDVLQAMHAQIDKLAYAHTRFFSTSVAEELADKLIDHAPAGMSRVYLVSGGSEAVEAAVRILRRASAQSAAPWSEPTWGATRPAPFIRKMCSDARTCPRPHRWTTGTSRTTSAGTSIMCRPQARRAEQSWLTGRASRASDGT